VKVLDGSGEFVDDVPGMACHRVRVSSPDGDTCMLQGDVVLIATGASPRILPGAEPDGERILTWWPSAAFVLARITNTSASTSDSRCLSSGIAPNGGGSRW
jgi:pyruvate/2-oxoglutarate dehydrogenase complex dihydrolipoamide dehydrogenase (E3) component